MKQHDITTKIMSNVVRFEKKRIWEFRRRFIGIVLMLFCLFILSAGIVFWQLRDMQAFESLMLFREDWQIISEYWQDTVLVFWEQVPQVWFWGVVLCLTIVGAILVFTRRKRLIDQKKLSQIRRLYE